MKSEITTHPMDGDWVDQAATLYLSRYKRHQIGDELERARITNAIRECLPAPERIDDKVPACLRTTRKYATAFEGLTKIMQGVEDPQQVAAAYAQTCVDE